ncbi:YEATS domain-containing protein 4 isoform X1 [Alligator mississippiensis]|nr:YEATS domain-containing protein 4 isoform X1 [Alligator mississippiensis]
MKSSLLSPRPPVLAVAASRCGRRTGKEAPALGGTRNKARGGCSRTLKRLGLAGASPQGAADSPPHPARADTGYCRRLRGPTPDPARAQTVRRVISPSPENTALQAPPPRASQSLPQGCTGPLGHVTRAPALQWQEGVTIVKPIVYGNVARYFGKKREEDGHTHQWTVYVKPYRNEDMSAYVKKIQFKLHESYGNPLRVVTKPPYEITETGWGEFEIIIKIFFIDPNERPVTLYHLLKLFQSDTNAILGKKTVVSEFYDEMIFQDPTAMMQQLLTTSRQLTLGAYKHETEFADLEVKTREKLEAAKKKTSFEIAELKERLKASRETINCLKNEIRKLEEDDQSKDI